MGRGEPNSKEQLAAEDSDDEAPEEFTLAKGKEDAQKSSAKEKDSQRRLAVAAKDKRRKKSQKTELEDPEAQPKKKSKRSQGRLKKGAKEGGDLGEVVMNQADLLPGNVLAELEQKERREVAELLARAQLGEDDDEPAQDTVARKRRKKDKLRVGNVEIAVLEEDKGRAIPPPPSAEAVRFQQDRLFGSRLKRSTTMVSRLLSRPSHTLVQI